MPKIRVKINEDESIIDAIIDNNIIKYMEPENTSVSYDLENNILERDNEDIHMIYDFNNKNGSILVKEMERELEISIENILIDRLKNNIKVNYSIENNDFLYELEVLEWAF